MGFYSYNRSGFFVGAALVDVLKKVFLSYHYQINQAISKRVIMCLTGH